MDMLSQYEVAWNMFQAGSRIEQIAGVVSKHRATVYRWIKAIKQKGLQQFLDDRRCWSYRKPSRVTSEGVVNLIVQIRTEFRWCGQKIRKELAVNHGVSIAVSTIYRWLHKRLGDKCRIKKYTKYKPIITASEPRELVEHDTVDLGGKKENVYAYTAIDIFTREPSVFIGHNLEMATGAKALRHHKQYYGKVETHQSDNGSEFQADFVVEAMWNGSKHQYSRAYKKNEQAHIENFNRSLRSECFPRGGNYKKKDIPQLQMMADAYCQHFINRRWHMGLPEMMTPKQFIDTLKKDDNETQDLSQPP